MSIEVVEIKDDKPAEVNFGVGVEMLMNDKKKPENNKSNSSDIGMKELEKLETELNDLSNNVVNNDSKILENASFSLNLDDNDTSSPPKESSTSTPSISLIGKVDKPEKTWDGFKPTSEIPIIEPDHTKSLSKEEILKKKFYYLKKIEELERKGVKMSKRYSMDSNLNEMIGEYETIIEEKEASNSIKFQGKILMACITGIEFLNNKFDPFDIKLDGWAESVNENIDDYDEIFTELHKKYQSKAKIAPELKLLFQLAGSAIMLHMTNTMFKSSLPGMEDIMRQNPELMQQFTQAAVNSMGPRNDGFSSFMNDMMDKEDRFVPPGSSPDISNTFNEERGRRERVIPPDHRRKRPESSMTQSKRRTDAVDIRDTFSEVEDKKVMSGPKDIGTILSNIKKKEEKEKDDDVKSTISIDDFNTLKTMNDSVPLKSKRRKKSERNTISLNI